MTGVVQSWILNSAPPDGDVAYSIVPPLAVRLDATPSQTVAAAGVIETAVGNAFTKTVDVAIAEHEPAVPVIV